MYPGYNFETIRKGRSITKVAPPHFSVDADLRFRDCSSYVSFDLSCYELKHFKKNRAALVKIRDACNELLDALDEAESMCVQHMEDE